MYKEVRTHFITKVTMKNILFINPCLRANAKVKYPPVGLAYVLHAVQRAGYTFDFLDLDVNELTDDQLTAWLSQKKYDMCGIGCIVTGLSVLNRVLDKVRETSPQCVIFAGNSVATAIPEMILRNSAVDVAVLGEGDITTVELIQALCNGTPLSAVAGIAYLEGDHLVRTSERPCIEDLDSIGFPNWDIFDLDLYHKVSVRHLRDNGKHEILYPLNGARGCPYSCTFCYHVFKGQKYRKYSEKMITNEFIRLSQHYGATAIIFWDELTFVDIAAAQRMTLALEALPFRTLWRATSRANLFGPGDVPLIRQMKEAGCDAIAFSIENASPEILRAMNKKIDHKKTRDHAHALQQGGVTPYTSLIFGYPQETPETIKATLDLCEECGIYPSAGFLLPLPGTPVYKDACQRGIITNEWEYLMHAGDRQDFYVNMTSMPDDELVDCVNSGMNALAKKMGLNFDNPLKTAVYTKPAEKKSV